MSLQTILADIALERARQDEKWGGPKNDDKYSPLEWRLLLSDYLGWASRMWSMGNLEKARRRFIQLAALSIAVVERIDRYKNGR